ncbi:MAG: amino acid adenylation domain-containing protein, partial [Clostridia bacterium]|nr:amino acid adenylation domain-containing protein [Clostridia bacterium]
ELAYRSKYLAGGYNNQPEKTLEVFVEDPPGSGQCVYKSGDLGRRLPDGRLEYLGRRDFQVKIRGYRIEAGEVEAAIEAIDGVKESVVVQVKNSKGESCLAAYYTTSEGVELGRDKIKDTLNKNLPGYMVPTYYVKIESIPLTPNNKVDREALPEIRENEKEGYEPPCSQTQEKLAGMWKDILGIDEVGINQDFFELGGHSLKATTLIARIHRELNVEVSLKEVFSSPTIKQLAAYIDSACRSNYKAILPVEKSEWYEVSSAQKRMYLIYAMDQSSTAYNEGGITQIEGNLDRKQLEEAFEKLIQRHETLRTSFEVKEEKIVQIIHENVEFKIDYFEAKEEVSEIIKSYRRSFDLSKAPLIRVGLVKTGEKRHILICDTHHIIFDGTSMGILIRDFASLYEGVQLPELSIQYNDFSAWQNEFFRGETIKRQEQYWIDTFSGEIPELNMPADYPRPAVQSFEGSSINFEIGRELTKKLNELAKETGSTTYMVLLAAYNVLLFKYTGQEDIVVGTPIAGRQHGDLQGIIGMFINTLAMRNHPEGGKTYKEFLHSVKMNALRAYENQDYQFEMLLEKLDIKRDLSRNPLFDTMLMLQNMDIKTVEISSLKFKEYIIDSKKSKLDITLNAVERDEQVFFTFEYCTELFKEETMQRLAGHYIKILEEVLENPAIKLENVSMLSEKEKQKLLFDFNNTALQYPIEQTISQLFEKQVKDTPENIALVIEEKRLTYMELNEKANQLARLLIRKGVKSNFIVGLMVERSLEMIIGIIGILKAGGAYLPLDPDYPQDRINYMLEDSGVKLLLTQKSLKEKIAELSIESVYIEEDAIYQGEATNLGQIGTSEDLAYVIYTSGSTGKPKGVMLEQRGVNNFIQGITEKIEFIPGKTILALTTICFDIFVLETLLSLTKGLRVVIATEEQQKDVRALREVILNNNIDMLQMTPSRLQLLMSEREITKCLRKISELMIGGEAFPKTLLDQVRSVTQARIYNMYGPTETTVWSAVRELTQLEEMDIGKPIANTSIYILDKNNQLQAIGIPGELCIAGDGLARGYLNRHDLTAEKFVSNPFVEAGRMYRTGDLARWLPDGNIEFLGRMDNQVKIRGHRIEVGEVESCILSHPMVKEAVVVTAEDTEGNKSLAAYYVATSLISSLELREHIAKELPDYMVPTYFVQLEKMPMTLNGKIDRKSLPSHSAGQEYKTEIVEPRNEMEERLTAIWKEVLRIDRIGIEDNFYGLGGDSIKAIQVVAKTNQLGLNIAVKDIVKYKTIALIVENVNLASVDTSIIQKEVEGNIPLIPIQKWFFERNTEYRRYRNHTNMFLLGSDTDLTLLEGVFRKIIQHHDALRMSFKIEDGQVVQYNRKMADVQFNLDIVDLSEFTYEEQIEIMKDISEKVQDGLDIEKDLLIKGIVFDLAKQGKRLMISINCLVIDGVSWRILLEDINKLYQSQLQYVLPQKTSSFKDWAERLQNYSIDYFVDVDYWEKIDPLIVKPLTKVKIGDNKPEDFKCIEIQLDNKYTTKLLSEANKAFDTETYEILLSALTLSLADAFEVEGIAIALEGHGREEIIEGVDLSRTVGCFTARYPGYFEKQAGLKETILYTKENLRDMPGNGLNFGISRYIDGNELIKLSDLQVSFQYLGQLESLIDKDEHSLLSVCPEQSGSKIKLSDKHYSCIDIAGTVIDGKMQFSIEYNAKYIEHDEINRFTLLFEKVLKDIAEYCSEIADMGICGREKSKEEVVVSVKRQYNISFIPSYKYPFYVDCTTGALCEKLKYEENIQILPSFLYAGEGHCLIGHISLQDIVRNTGMLKYFGINFGHLEGMGGFLKDELGVLMHTKTFPTLDEGMRYCHKLVKENKLAFLRGTTYFLNFSPDYYIDKEEYIQKMNNWYNQKDGVSDPGTMLEMSHAFLLVDITKRSYVVYDSSFDYFGEMNKSDLYKAFKGISALEFMKGHPANEVSPPYIVHEVDSSNINKVAPGIIGMAILKKNLKRFLVSKRVEIEQNGARYNISLGLAALKDLADEIQVIAVDSEKTVEIKDFFTQTISSFEYKFIFFRDFLKDIATYCNVPGDIIRGLDKNISLLNAISDKARNSEIIDFRKYFSKAKREIYKIYSDLNSLFARLDKSTD